MGSKVPMPVVTFLMLDQQAVLVWKKPCRKWVVLFDHIHQGWRVNIHFDHNSWPTGLGKTFIAATIMLNWFRWTSDSPTVFVAPTNLLCPSKSWLVLTLRASRGRAQRVLPCFFFLASSLLLLLCFCFFAFASLLLLPFEKKRLETLLDDKAYAAMQRQWITERTFKNGPPLLAGSL